MRRTTIWLFALALGACSGMQFRSTLAPAADVARYRTYAWLRVDGMPEQPETIVDQRVRGALARALAQKGLVPATAGAPDFLVGYHVLEERKTGVTDWGNGLYGWSPEVTTYTNGTLIVDFIDPRTNAVFWRGSVEGAIEPPGEIDPRRLEHAANELVRRYPSTLASREAHVQ